MSRRDDIQRLITEHNRRLQRRKEQAAQYGIAVEPHIVNEIEDIEAKIADLQTELENLEKLSRRNPYRGLSIFGEEDANFFCGRKTFTTQLVESVQQKPLVAVLGASGSGKSSIVFAGLIPSLRSEDWLIAAFRPGSDPFRALAAALLPLLEPTLGETDRLVETRKMTRALNQDDLMLSEVVTRIREKTPDADRLLLVIDQFEELYTLCPDSSTRLHFLDTLLNLLPPSISQSPTTNNQPPASLVLTLRADFLGQALAYRPLANALREADVKLGPMTPEELRQAIEKPAETQGVSFEVGLVERILDDVSHEPGHLPLLEFALTALWEQQQRGELTHAAYEAVGRVEGALSHHAEQVFERLSEAEQERARRVFVQMVRPGEGTEDTRRLATKVELGEASWNLIQRLASQRLVVTDRNPEEQETVEVVHEALIQGWARLRRWMDEDRLFRAWQERLRFARRQWQESNQDEGALLRGAPLAEAEAWLAERKGYLSLAERDFIQTSVMLREHETAERGAQRQRELEAAQRLAAEAEARRQAEAQRAEAERLRAEDLAFMVSISATLDLDVTLRRVLNRAVKILHAEAGSLLLLDPSGQELVFEVVTGSGEELLGVRYPVGKGIVGTVAQTGQPLVVNDVAADPRWISTVDEATGFHTKDMLCVPMVADEKVVGIIQIINKQDGTVFTEEEANLLSSFGAQAAIAIKNAQLYTRTDQALAERVQELQTIQMFEQELQTSLELVTVLDMSLSRIMDALGISMGLIGILKDEQEPGLYLLAQRGMPMELGRYKVDPWPLTKGILGRVAQTGELAWVNDISQNKDYVPKNHRARCLLVVPIKREDRVVGVIDLESTEPDYFTSDDVDFVKLLISHAAMAIENAQLFEQVREANQAKAVFMNTASHELKIPMTSIKGYAKLLQMGTGGTLNEQQKDFLTVISNNVDRMSQLVHDLLDVSRIEAGRIRLEIQDVQMQNVISEVLESVQDQIENKHLNLTVDIATDLPTLRADYSRVTQILTNLVSNAYKYTPEDGRISVIAKPYYDNFQGISVAVKDTGYGISEEDQAQLLTKFFRSSDQNIRDQPGTGLGLTIAKAMVELHGGGLTVESKPGAGSTFAFTLPVISKIPSGIEVVER